MQLQIALLDTASDTFFTGKSGRRRTQFIDSPRGKPIYGPYGLHLMRAT